MLTGWPPAMLTVAGQADVGDLSGSDAFDERLELGQVDVALEGVQAGGVVGLVDDDVDEGAAGQLLVQPGGREVHVARHPLRRA